HRSPPNHRPPSATCTTAAPPQTYSLSLHDALPISAAWELLWDAREAYSRAKEAQAKAMTNAPGEAQLARSFESLLAAEGSDWCWWYGPEHSTPNDAEFDSLYRKHLTGVYLALGQAAPPELAKPIKRQPEHALHHAPSAWLNVV